MPNWPAHKPTFRRMLVVVAAFAFDIFISGCCLPVEDSTVAKIVDTGGGVFPPDDFTGTWEVYWPSGQLKYRAKIIDGKEHGIVRCYWENGIVAQLTEMEHGQVNGRWIDYYEDGTLKRSAFCREGRFDGVWHKYYSTGDPWEEVTWKEGKREGRAVEYSVFGEIIACHRTLTLGS